MATTYTKVLIADFGGNTSEGFVGTDNVVTGNIVSGGNFLLLKKT